jgi:hypothetical protein
MGRKDDYLNALLNAWGDDVESVPQPHIDPKKAVRVVKEASAKGGKKLTHREIKAIAKDAKRKS